MFAFSYLTYIQKLQQDEMVYVGLFRRKMVGTNYVILTEFYRLKIFFSKALKK